MIDEDSMSLIEEVPEGTAMISTVRVVAAPLVLVTIVDEPQGKSASIALDYQRVSRLHRELENQIERFNREGQTDEMGG